MGSYLDDQVKKIELRKRAEKAEARVETLEKLLFIVANEQPVSQSCQTEILRVLGSAPSASPLREDEPCPMAGMTDPPVPCIFRKGHEGGCSFTVGFSEPRPGGGARATMPGERPSEAQAFRNRHIRCSQGAFDDGMGKIYKHASDCEYPNEHTQQRPNEARPAREWSALDDNGDPPPFVPIAGWSPAEDEDLIHHAADDDAHEWGCDRAGPDVPCTCKVAVAQAAVRLLSIRPGDRTDYALPVTMPLEAHQKLVGERDESIALRIHLWACKRCSFCPEHIGQIKPLQPRPETAIRYGMRVRHKHSGQEGRVIGQPRARVQVDGVRDPVEWICDNLEPSPTGSKVTDGWEQPGEGTVTVGDLAGLKRSTGRDP